jgi:hypothetical protein
MLQVQPEKEVRSKINLTMLKYLKPSAKMQAKFGHLLNTMKPIIQFCFNADPITLDNKKREVFCCYFLIEITAFRCENQLANFFSLIIAL